MLKDPFLTSYLTAYDNKLWKITNFFDKIKENIT